MVPDKSASFSLGCTSSSLLSRELTFESFLKSRLIKEVILYLAIQHPGFLMEPSALCDDELQPHMLDLALEKLSYFPVASVRHA